MPISPQGFTAVLVPNLLSVAMVGTRMPKFCRGLATGYSIYLRKVTVNTTDAGTAGAGKGAPIPLLIPPQIWLLQFTRSFAQNKVLGIMAPLFLTGLSNGMNLATIQVLTNTAHPTVGVGAGVPSLQTPPAFPDLKLGFTQVGIDADPRVVRALASGIEKSLRTFIVPIPIAGPPSPSGASGRGTGTLI